MILYVCVALTLALGALVQTVAGFGSALVAMPVLTQILGVQVAAPVQALLGLLTTVTVLYRNWGGLRWREASLLMAGGVLGIPLGTLALKSLPSEPVVGCLGMMLLAYAAFALWIQPRLQMRSSFDEGKSINAKLISWIVGFTSGVLGGAYATDGPPLIVFGSIKRWPKETFRSILQACFLVNGIAVVTCHAMGGLITHEVLTYCCFGFPGLLGGMLLGIYLDRRVDHDRFRGLLLILIIVLGAALLGRAVFGG